MTVHALSQLTTPNPQPQPAARPAPSPYDPPLDMQPYDRKERTHDLHVQGDVKVSRYIVWQSAAEGTQPEIVRNYLYIETGDRADRIHVRDWPGNKLQIIINGESHVFDVKDKDGKQQGLWIDTKGGNDQVIIDPDVRVHVDVEGGDGDDYIQAGAGRTRLYGGDGNDVLRLGSGLGYAAGNEGNDTIIGGTGNAVMYGNKGNDRLYAGFGPSTKQSYMDGGDGNDHIYAGSGHSVLHGGNGDDHLVGHDRTTFYTGKGRDTICSNQRNDTIYAKPTDHFDRAQGSRFVAVNSSDAGARGFTVQPNGTHGFNQQVEDDLEFLRSSPVGQQLLARMDELAVQNGGAVTIEQGLYGETFYRFNSTELENVPPEAEHTLTDSQVGVIVNGVPGARADRGLIGYQHQAILETADRSNTLVPVTGLYHEMLHAYNGATGTKLSGESYEYPQAKKPKLVDHEERQVIGLPNPAEPFDFDNDASTPPSTVNPEPFTENALNKEMGKPLRRTYLWNPSSQGKGL